MRKPLSLSAAIVLLAAGFAVASIATGGSLAAVSHVWTSITGTTPTVTVMTTTTGNGHGRGIVICDRFNRGHHRFGVRTIVVTFHELHHRLGDGAKLGPCVVLRGHHGHHGHHGLAFGHDPTTTTTTTAVTTTSAPSGFVGKGTTGGQGGDDDGDDDGGNRGGNGGNWNNFVPNFGHGNGHRGHGH